MRASRSTSRLATVSTASGRFASSTRVAQLLDLVALALAELLLDRLQLLAQVVLPLRVGHLLLRLRLDLALHLEQRDLARERLRHHLELRQQRVGLEQLLLLVGRHVEQAAEQVRQPQRVVDGRRRRRAAPARSRWRATARDRPAPAGAGRRRRLRRMRSTCSGSAWIIARIDSPVRVIDVGAHAREALDDDVKPRRVARHLADDADRADPLHVVRARIVELVLLQHQQQHAIAAERAVHRFDRHRPVHRERLHAERKRDRAPERQHGKLGRQREEWSMWIRA